MWIMAKWTKTFKREPPKTKIELRAMLAEAARNTQADAECPPQAVSAKAATSPG
jgi:hypothetical protein